MTARPLCVTLLVFSGILASGLAGCGSDAFSAATPSGTERGVCRSDGSCDEGLECRSDVCVSSAGGSGAGGSSGSSSGGSSNMSAAGISNDSGNNSGGTNAEGGTSAEGGTNAAGGMNATGGTDTSEGGGGAGGAGGAAVQCEGAHPLVSDKNRYCEVGACYCNEPFDTCFPEDTAATCCANTPRCGDQPADRGVNCTGSHPIIGPPRTCAPGSCFCSDGDANTWDVCLPNAVAESCCPPGVSLTCVE